VIRLNLPALTEERRRELAKHVGHEGESAKIAVRNVRRDALQQVKNLLKEMLVSEDDERRFDEEVQNLTDNAIKEIDSAVKAKEDELMAL
jgi:ribosome recycling factor